MKKALFLASALLASSPAHADVSKVFTLEGSAGIPTPHLYVTGIIKEGDTKKLIALQNTPKIYLQVFDVVFNSPGGNVIEAMKMGRAIRRLHLTTEVARYVPFHSPPDPDSYIEEKGACYSACTLAFLGGTSRSVFPGSNYGVHRFYYETNEKVKNPEQVAQTLSAMIIDYMREMGIDPQLFSEMAGADANNDIRVVPKPERRRLGVETYTVCDDLPPDQSLACYSQMSNRQ